MIKIYMLFINYMLTNVKHSMIFIISFKYNDTFGLAIKKSPTRNNQEHKFWNAQEYSELDIWGRQRFNYVVVNF